ncbi:MAG: hypothetical protein KUG77_14555 [Nannocystaceae bacterium]|nr:hypothetical protein [Nannocystaceae bacterium]
MTARAGRVRWLLVVVAALQVLLVAAVPRHGSVWAGLALAAAMVVLFVVCRRLPPRLGTAMLATACFGGGGMFVGSLIDLLLAAPVPPCHRGVFVLELGAVTNWMSGLMLIGCASGCWILCPRRDGLLLELLQHALAAVAMWLGMFAGARALGPSFTGLGVVGGMHLAMLAGMLVGVGAFQSVGLLLRRESRPCALP